MGEGRERERGILRVGRRSGRRSGLWRDEEMMWGGMLMRRGQEDAVLQCSALGGLVGSGVSSYKIYKLDIRDSSKAGVILHLMFKSLNSPSRKSAIRNT